MGEPARAERMTAAEYLAFERASETKHEFADGEVFAMAGSTREHSLIATNTLAALHAALADRPCEVHAADLRVKIASADRYVYPDATVACGDLRFEDGKHDTLLNPTVVVEVLSDSTEAYDRGDKFAQYRTIPSLADYVLLSQKSVLVEHFHREADGSWRLRVLGPGDALELASVGARVPVERLYLKVAFGETAGP